MNTEANCDDVGTGAQCRPEPMITALVVAGVAALAAFTIFGEIQAQRTMGLLGLDIAVGALSCALVPVLLRWPVACALALSVLAAVSPAATPAATAAALVVAQRRPFPTAVEVAGAGIAMHAVQGLWRPAGGLSFVWWLALMIAAYAALLGWGALTQARRALMASLRERARRAEAEQGRRVAEARVSERTRIAREMHDVLAHRLSLVATYAGALEYRPDSPPEQLALAAGVVRDGVRQALIELREVIGVLRDGETTDDDESGQRPQPVLADIPRLVEESHHAGEQVVLDGRTPDTTVVPAVAGRAAYRVVQEGLTNARKHAAGQPVHVVLAGEPGTELVIDIHNPLSRDAPARPSVPGSGTGLIGLTERVHLAGGRLDHETTATGEFHLHARLPWLG
ncbi:histidine kinase [Streptomyces sp. H10-C2]|uniref:sensor histidine kinase n=1 Tax=unclassified Streptomyces TaxID=2593676 RepID=UPI0024BA6455|nr:MULTISPECIES: histidine kinase [unclassified Streptomyces]MDJ0347644.1 histidine kinase [Streptomyces sp. PH10-H1]MDJ0375816.1 histidine kinase [Streptomyces sp. H10-C2]